MAVKGCAYGQVTRQIAEDIKSDISDIKVSMKSLDDKVTNSCNHLSNRPPLWATALISFLIALVSVFAAIALKP